MQIPRYCYHGCHVLVVFQASAHIGSNMPTLLDGAECTRVIWEQSLSDVSGFENYTPTAESMTQHSSRLSIDSAISH
jgi:hypothetical protein